MYTLTYSLQLGPAHAATNDLRAQLMSVSGANVGSAISTGFINIGSGFHMWTYANMLDSHRGGVKFYSNAAPTVVLAFLSVNPQEAENADVKSSLLSTLTTSDIDARLAAYNAPTKAELDTAQSTIIDAIPTPAEIDTELSDTHGAGGWATATGFATPTNVTTTQAAIIAAIAALNDLSDEQAEAAAAAAISAAGLATTGSVPTAADVAAAVFAKAVESGYSLQTVLQKLFAAVAGKSITDDPQSPTWFEYYAPDGSTLRLRHDIVDTTRNVG